MWPRWSWVLLGLAGTFLFAATMLPPFVRYGSQADMTPCDFDVRSYPKSGHSVATQ
jgi:hypothetical protein